MSSCAGQAKKTLDPGDCLPVRCAHRPGQPLCLWDNNDLVPDMQKKKTQPDLSDVWIAVLNSRDPGK